MMDSAAEALESVLQALPLGEPKLPVYANLTASPYGKDGKKTLLSQLKNPVRWQETLENLKAAGADTFIECGPGKTLSGLVKKTLKDVRILRVENEETLRETLAALNG